MYRMKNDKRKEGLGSQSSDCSLHQTPVERLEISLGWRPCTRTLVKKGSVSKFDFYIKQSRDY